MKKALFMLSAAVLLTAAFLGCGKTPKPPGSADSAQSAAPPDGRGNTIAFTDRVTTLTDGLSAVSHSGSFGFERFLAEGGASSDAEVVSFLAKSLPGAMEGLRFDGSPFGCSTVAVKGPDGGALFGRNFDWNPCSAMIVQNLPEEGYRSVSTVNMDFIDRSSLRLSSLPDGIQALICLYAPLDGMNEAGLAVAVNMIQDSATIHQNTNRPDLTTTTAIRLLLDKAADTEEAVGLLRQYDMHASMGYMMHLAIADSRGNSVVVEYVDNEMIVTAAPVVTNFYLSEGKKYGVGTQQSHERYDILTARLAEEKAWSMDKVRDALDRVSKDNFEEFASTEWSVVMDQSAGVMRYYHREHYQNAYTCRLKGGGEG